MLPWNKKDDDGASFLADTNEVKYGLKTILDLAYYEEDEDLEIISEEVECSAVSLAVSIYFR